MALCRSFAAQYLVTLNTAADFVNALLTPRLHDEADCACDAADDDQHQSGQEAGEQLVGQFEMEVVT
jgi:hypothetical protein